MGWVRTHVFVFALVGAGCSVEGGRAPEYGLGGSSPPVAMSGTDGDEGGDSEGSSGDEEVATAWFPADEGDGSGSGSDGVGDEGPDPETGSSDGGDEGTTGAQDMPPGQQPESGMYSDCMGNSDCQAGMGCIGVVPLDAICTASCIAPDNPGNCDPSPGGTALVRCAAIASNHVCVLDCEGGRSCPAGMSCWQGDSDEGQISICL